MLIYYHLGKNQPARAKASFRPCLQNQALTCMILAGHPWHAQEALNKSALPQEIS